MTIQHPWVESAEQIGMPQPCPSVLKFNNVTMTTPDGMRQDVVLFTMATPFGVNTAFMAAEDLDNHIEAAQEARKNMTSSNLLVAPSIPDNIRNINGFGGH